MIVAVASGKGGTGKTTVAASLAAVWTDPVQAVDLDVEEPNLHLFLKPEWERTLIAGLAVPLVKVEACPSASQGCRACADLCQFKAISVLAGFVVTFPEMCHGCGGCQAVCPDGNLGEGSRELGEIMWGRRDRIDFLMGRLRVSEAMSPPLIKAVRRYLRRESDVIIDAPPGTSCPAVSAVAQADVLVLVTEPTPFGLHDLRLAREALSAPGRIMGVVVNKAGLGNDDVFDYCRSVDLPIWMEIPFDRSAAQAYAQGRIMAEARPEWWASFERLADHMKMLVGHGTGGGANA